MHAQNSVFRRLAAVWRGTLAALVLALVGCSSPAVTTERGQSPKNIIILFADGTAPTQWDFGRYSSSVLRGQPFATTDVVFREGVLGLLTTSPLGVYVTDSAAAASAMSTGFKVTNGAVSMTPEGTPRRTLMQAARRAGKRIGLVTTATVFDATPAAFSVNAKSRRDSQALVDLYVALEPDVLLGGGAEYFLPKGTAGGKRSDGKDIIGIFRAKGYQVARDAAQLGAATGAKLIGLFADDDMDFEIDRDSAKEPSTAQMAAAALKALSQQSPNGFVLLVENENTDTAGHTNDAAALMRALWAFDDAVKVALEFQRSHPDTLLIVTGDHETGGFAPTSALKDLSSLSGTNRFTADDEHLRMLGRISMSLTRVHEQIGKKPSGEALDRLVAKHFPGFHLDGDLRELILNGKTNAHNLSYLPQNMLGQMVARQTGFYWSTSGHTSEPVAVGAIGPGAGLFRGMQDNTDFGKHLHRLLENR
jgi:alkaline phosphatase